jgi:hypothetical protein
MRRSYPTVSSAQVQSDFAAELAALGPWVAVGRSLSVEALLRLLGLMVAWRASLHAVFSRVAFGCSQTTARLGIRRQLPTLAELSARLSQRLVGGIGRRRKDGFHVAIDTHYSPYYGDGSTAGVVRGQLKASTRKFFVYATACVVERGRRYTLAVTAVESGRPDAALEPLLQHLAACGVTIRSLTLDKAFFAAAVFARLHRAAIPYLVAVPHNRRCLRWFLRPRVPAAADYRLRSRTPGRAEVTIRLRRVRYRRDGRWRTEVYAVRRLGRLSDDQLRVHYRRRFAIESSYRQLREVKAPTTSPDRVWRLLLIGLALLLRQLWAVRDAARAATSVAKRPAILPLRKLAWLLAQGLAPTRSPNGDQPSASGHNGP